MGQILLVKLGLQGLDALFVIKKQKMPSTIKLANESKSKILETIIILKKKKKFGLNKKMFRYIIIYNYG